MFGVFQPRTDRPAVEATRSFLYTNTTNPPLAEPGTWPMNLQEPVSLLLKLWEAPSLRMEHIPGRWMSHLLVSKHRVVKVMRGLQSKLCACRCSGNSLFVFWRYLTGMLLEIRHGFTQSIHENSVRSNKPRLLSIRFLSTQHLFSIFLIIQRYNPATEATTLNNLRIATSRAIPDVCTDSWPKDRACAVRMTDGLLIKQISQVVVTISNSLLSYVTQRNAWHETRLLTDSPLVLVRGLMRTIAWPLPGFESLLWP